MNALVGEVSPELYSPWNPIARIVALISFALLGVALWAHAALHPDSTWYVVAGESYSGLYELLGVMFIATTVVGSIPVLIMPWQALRARRHFFREWCIQPESRSVNSTSRVMPGLCWPRLE